MQSIYLTSRWRRWLRPSPRGCRRTIAEPARTASHRGRGPFLRPVLLCALSDPVHGQAPYNGVVYTWLVSDGLTMTSDF